MNKLIEQIKTTYGHLSTYMIEEYDRRQYMRFFKGRYVNIEWPRAGLQVKVSLATACFHIGQGFTHIRSLYEGLSNGIGSLRTIGRNRHK